MRGDRLTGWNKRLKGKFMSRFGKNGGLFHRYLKNQDGVSAIEYAFIAAATGTALALTLPTLQANLTTLLLSIWPS